MTYKTQKEADKIAEEFNAVQGRPMAMVFKIRTRFKVVASYDHGTTGVGCQLEQA